MVTFKQKEHGADLFGRNKISRRDLINFSFYLEQLTRAGVPLLGRVPMDPAVGRAAEEGKSIFQAAEDSAAAVAVQRIVDQICATLGM